MSLRRRAYSNGIASVGAPVRAFKGPNGNIALGYQWSWTWGGDEEERGAVKVSDWSRANTCAHCGKKVVHAYWVQRKDGTMAPYGERHLHKALGYPYELSGREIEKIRLSIGHPDS